MTKKKVILASAVLLAIGAVGYGGSSAYFSDYDNKPNTVTVGHNDTTIEEKFPDPTPKPVEDNPSYPKKVWVTNDGNGEALVDCYVRAEVTFSNSDIGQAVTLEGLNTADWTLGGDGFYYYKHILKKGESTTPLFTGVRSILIKWQINIRISLMNSRSMYTKNLYSQMVSQARKKRLRG